MFVFFAAQDGRISTTGRAGMIRVKLRRCRKASRSLGVHAPGRPLISRLLRDSNAARASKIRVESEPSRVQVQPVRFTQLESARTDKAIKRCRSSKPK